MRFSFPTFLVVLAYFFLPSLMCAQSGVTKSLSLFPSETWQVPTNSWLTEQVHFHRPEPIQVAEVKPSPYFLPKFAQENPTGYSYLCRQELEIERKSPVGIWVEVEPDEYQKSQIFSGPRLRFRVPVFMH